MSEPAIPAATLIVQRPAPGGPPQYLMVERAAAMAFAGGAWVFPGGRIDDADRALALGLGLGGEDGAARVAAIRETIEETAVPVGLAPLPDATTALAIQRELIAGRDFAEALAAHGLALDPDALTAFARWVPKFHAVRRFDTMFFIAEAPPGDWQPTVDPGENRAAEWLGADAVLERERSGSATLIFPTRRNLERLALHADFAALAADARTHAVAPITPWVEERGGARFITIPEGIGYPVTSEPLEGLWRG